jgi:SAM-dependent methyltransferase
MCSADARIYDSKRLAACYAVDRPPVHGPICARLFAAMAQGHPAGHALDIGCGAGASTAALAPYATHITGVDPFPRMLELAQAALPAACCVRGRAEALPFAAGSFDIITAAGSLNYADVDAALAEVSRVLAPGGYFAPYDFSTGRVRAEGSRADDCFREFELSFPWPGGYSLDLGKLPFREHGMMLIARETFFVDIEMSASGYIRYLMGETNVEAAIARGMNEHDAEEKCLRIFGPLFAHGAMPVTFRAEFALARAFAKAG